MNGIFSRGNMKKRNPIIATLWSIFTPGIGQVYNGQIIKGGIYYLMSLLLPLSLGLIGLQYSFYGMVCFVLLVIGFRLVIIGDALVVSIKKKEISLKPYHRWYFYLIFTIIILVISVFSEDFMRYQVLGAKAYKVPSAGMSPTIVVGDHIMTNLKYYKNNKPQKGELIVFRSPDDSKKDYVRRVIGTEGDTVEIKNKKVFVNGKEVVEPYAKYADDTVYPAPKLYSFQEEYQKAWEQGSFTPAKLHIGTVRDNFGPVTMPVSKIFVLGDNRDGSYDSRFFGCVDVSQIKGRAIYIYWSKNKDHIGLRIQ